MNSDDCVFFPDLAVDPVWLDWPIVWCPDARFHEQGNIRPAQGGRATRRLALAAG
jgi:hypothetical protein